MNMEKHLPIGHSWRSSKWFILSTVAIALFAETFLYGFLVPILGEMIQNRLHVHPSKAQELTSVVLALHGTLAVLSAPIIGHYADKNQNRKTALLLSLGWCIVGTGTVAGARSVPMLLLGRVMQGIAGSAVWIIGFATVADTISPTHIGFALSIMMSCANTGTIGGPAIAGLLLEVAGYWLTWSVPLVVLTIDFIARVCMIENPASPPSTPDGNPTETASLLPSHEEDQVPPEIGNLWRIMLCNGRAMTCLLTIIMGTTLNTSLDATLPLYVEEKFGWGPSTAGLLFAGLVVPGVLIGPVAGCLRDRIGTQIPTVICATLQAIVLGVMGLAGSDVPWASAQNMGKPLYATCIVALGTLRPFVSGIAPVELTATTKAMQERSPGIFGPKGGMSRVFSMMDVAASLGMIIGPIIGGSLKEMLGYRYMSWTWSKFVDLIGLLC
ncbi:Major facilitator superfamily domain general substrate transporter [Penicillium coprophilum]|uniref:Major facilitator superfamily domain general substrate transporter n=1 Tax=Penicillium coprophilum TaxID=36646 RepID=UPI0023A12476|nr:Major facilitator superfamily domain general substrate transporter [Penicillium coprophilum]KAJ5169846.1 Major facilitator superfamily domain general substrate transporter [Penicillium coprophilum]